MPCRVFLKHCSNENILVVFLKIWLNTVIQEQQLLYPSVMNLNLTLTWKKYWNIHWMDSLNKTFVYSTAQHWWKLLVICSYFTCFLSVDWKAFFGKLFLLNAFSNSQYPNFSSFKNDYIFIAFLFGNFHLCKQNMKF